MSVRRIALPIIAAIVTAGPTAQQTAPPTFTARVDAVRVPVTVINNSRPVQGLRPEQFSLKDNGVPQEITASASIDTLDVTLLLDVSHSVGTTPLARLRGIASQIVSSATVDERLALTVFADAAFAVTPPSVDRKMLSDRLAALESQPFQRTALWDAVAVASAATRRALGRPYVVALTDGCDNASWMTPATLARWLAQTDATVDLVFFGSVLPESLTMLHWSNDICYGPLRLEEAIGPSGGLVFKTADRSVEHRLTERLSELRSGYFLTYTPQGVRSDDGWHKIEVSLNGAKGRVTARPGYFSGSAGNVGK
jgi:VWFA-related protein